MTAFTLEYGDGPQEVAVSSIAELDRLLDEISANAQRAERPELPTLFDEEGRSLAVGLGHELSVLAWADDDEGSNPLLSEGDLQAEGNEVGFFYGNQYSYFPVTALIPVTVARDAMREFVTLGARPTMVRWQNP
jgi:hypothetical protein